MPPLRAISTLGCPDFTLAQSAELAKRHGLTAIELRSLAGTLDLPEYFASTFGTADAVKAVLAGAGVSIVSLDTSFPLIGNEQAQRDELERFAVWAEILGIPTLRVFDGGKTGSDAEFDEAAESFLWWQSLRSSKRWNVDIAVETHDLLFTSDLILRFCAEAPEVRILWDSHHTWKRGFEPPATTWKAIHPFVRHVHVKDSISKPSDRHPYTYVLPGDGEFPIAELHACLAEGGYVGPLALEWERRWHPYLPSLEDALAHAAAARWW